MTIEKGTLGEEHSDENVNDKEKVVELESKVEELTDLVKQLLNQKSQGLPQAATVAGGVTADQLREIILAVKDRPDTEKFGVGKFINESDIDPDDYDEKGLLFCAYSSGYLIVDDVRQGKSVSTPYQNAIFFEYQATKKVDVGKYQETSTYSSYVSKSKKEQEWLKQHRYFGICFFMSAKEALSADAKKISALMKIFSGMLNMNQHEIVQRCREWNVPISEDIRNMRMLLSHKMADKQMEDEKIKDEKRLSESIENEIFK
jgi:hypothetical protein